MSDIRTKLLLGTSIATVAMMFALVSSMGISENSVGVQQSSQLLGHVEMVFVDPDGTVSYVQGDNLVTEPGLNLAAARLYDANDAAPTFSCIQLGDDPAPVVGIDETALDKPLVNTKILCDTASPVTTTAQTNTPNGAISEIVVPITILATDGPTTITEVGLMQGDTGTITVTGLISHFVLAVAIPVVDGTVVTVTYTMTTDA